jgi:hypothetical protein
MKRERRRPIYLIATGLYDGTVLAASPIRKPHPKTLKRDGLRIDADGVGESSISGGKELSDWNYEGRTRFQDIIANRLNTRRSIRELVVPPMAKLQEEVTSLRAEVARLADLVAALRSRGTR